MSFDESQLRSRLEPPLAALYGPRAAECLERIMLLTRQAATQIPALHGPLWDQSDSILITYGDQVRSAEASPLATLGQFLASAGLNEVISAIHLLPFFPYSSDDGFSVIDYRKVDPALGGWADVKALGQKQALMFDLVLNHVSRASRWFADYAAGKEPYTRFFIEVSPEADLSAVVRPRSLPLLTPVETSRGLRHVWTTFSDDQIDLNYAEPDVLLEMLSVLLYYLQQGAKIIRLDAIAYLWKQIGTPCIHLPQTHEVVKLMRDLLDALAPGAILLTETNVPQEENVSYFGDGDEARMVYQFSLAPLLLEALVAGDATHLVAWLEGLRPTPPGTTVLNFTASHDGVGVRPLEGILPEARYRRLLETVTERGGSLRTRRQADGSESPSELTRAYASALSVPGEPQAVSVRRFLASQGLMLALQGIPGIYFHSLLATPNDVAGAERTGRARSINRRKFELAELQQLLGQPDSTAARVLKAYRFMLAQRSESPAFHPEAPQQVVRFQSPRLVGVLRTSLDGGQRILVLANVGSAPETVDPARECGLKVGADMLSPAGPGDFGGAVEMGPYQVCWLLVE